MTTIQEAKQAGHCRDCIYRVVGPGEMQCSSPHPEDKPCPGKRSREDLMREAGSERQ